MLNITDYKLKPEATIIHYGNFVLKKGFTFMDGNISFYHYVGAYSGYSMLELLHPDDVAGFLDAVDKLDNENQQILLRMKCHDDTYRWLFMELSYNDRVIEGFKSINIEFCDAIEIKNKYAMYMSIVKKYREFMSLSPGMYFEYSFESKMLSIYQYISQKAHKHVYMTLEDIMKKSRESDRVSAVSRAEFGVFCEFLENGANCFRASVNASVFFEDRNETFDFRGSTLYENGERHMVVGIIDVIDTTQEETSYYLSDYASDPGTGLLNKRAIHEYAVENAQKGKVMYLAMMDIDNFKNINDSFGHMYGDEVLSKIAEIIRSVLDGRGLPGRFGGDEFMIVFDGIYEEDELRRLLKTISKHMQWAFLDVKDTVDITTSCGIAKFPDDADNFEDLFKKADKALYIAKAKGKNRFIIYDEKKHGKIVNEEEQTRTTGIKAIVSNELKASVMSEIVLWLHNSGVSALEGAMEDMRSYFDMDGITIYAGADMKRAMTSGKYINPIEKMTWINDTDYLERFNIHGVYVESDISRISNMYADAYNQYQLQETRKFIQFVAYKDNIPAAVVSFDFFNRAPKIGTIDMGFINIVGKLMAQVASGLG